MDKTSRKLSASLPMGIAIKIWVAFGVKGPISILDYTTGWRDLGECTWSSIQTLTPSFLVLWKSLIIGWNESFYTNVVCVLNVYSTLILEKNKSNQQKTAFRSYFFIEEDWEEMFCFVFPGKQSNYSGI